MKQKSGGLDPLQFRNSNVIFKRIEQGQYPVYKLAVGALLMFCRGIICWGIICWGGERHVVRVFLFYKVYWT